MALGCACGTLAAAPSPSPDATLTITSAAEARAAIGKRVRFEGRAANAKISAVVYRKGLMIYCLDRSSWREVNQTIVVEGKLEQSDEFTSKPAPGEPIAAGTGGPVWVIRSCRVDARAPVD